MDSDYCYKKFHNMGSYPVEVAVQTVNLLSSDSLGSTPRLPTER